MSEQKEVNMDLRNKVSPVKTITLFVDRPQITLQELLDLCASSQIKPEDYDKILIYSDIDGVQARMIIPKTQQEIDDEIKQKQIERDRRRLAYEKGRETRAKRQLEKAEKAQKKLEILKTLTPEQREALGL